VLEVQAVVEVTAPHTVVCALVKLSQVLLAFLLQTLAVFSQQVVVALPFRRTCPVGGDRAV